MSRTSRPAAPESERRSGRRYEVEWAVDCVGEETFLYAEITNISQMGIFVSCQDPFEVGTSLTLKFRSNSKQEEFTLPGRVQWINLPCSGSGRRNPGMGIHFLDLRAEDRERIVEAIHTIAYVRDLSN